MIIRTDPHNKIARISHRITRHRHDTVHQRPAFIDRMVDRHDGVHVVDHTACVRRQHGRIDRSAGGRIDDLTLRALRILRLKRLHADTRLILRQLPEQLYTIRLVVLHCQYASRILEQLQINFQTVNQFLRLFQHTPVIRSEIRLTLRTVGDHIVYFLRFFRRQLDKSRESGAAHADNARFFDTCNDLLSRHIFERFYRRILYLVIESVILHYNAHHIVTGDYASWFDRLDGSGNGSIHRRRHETARLRDLLAGQHMISLCNDRFGRCTDVLRQRIDKISFRQHRFDRLILGQFFTVIRMNTALKC